MPDNQHWFLRVVRLMTKDEVKTPLSFLFKVLPYVLGTLIAVLYAPISDDLKITVIEIAMSTILIIVAIVFLFAWFRPKNLVYGETGHRAEYKIEYGSDKKIMDKEEFDQLQLSSDPERPLLEDK